MEAYKVWVTLNLKGDALEKMQKFTKATERAMAAVNKLKISMKPSISMFDQMAVNLRDINPQLDKMAKNINNIDNASRKLNRTQSSSRGFLSRASHFIPYGMGTGIGATYAAGSLIKKSYGAGVSYQQELAQLTGQNIPGLDAASVNKYIKNTKVKDVSKLELLAALNDAAVVTKSASSAKQLAPLLGTYQSLSTQMFGEGEYKVGKKQIQAAIKTAELASGSKDYNVLAPYIDMMFKAQVNTGGRVRPSDYFSTVKNMRGYAKGLDPKFLFYMLDPFIQEYGQRTGTQLGQFFNRMKAGRITAGGAALLKQGGLLTENNIQNDKIGRPILIRNIKGMDKQNPFEWITNTFQPFLERLGAKTEQQKEAIAGRIFTNTDLAFVLTMMQQQEKFKSMYSQNQKGAGIQEMQNSLMGSNPERIKAFNTAFSNFKLALDGITGPTVTSGLIHLTNGLNALTGALNWLSEQKEGKHPKGLLGEWIDSRFPSKSSNSFQAPTGDLTKNSMTTHVTVKLDPSKMASSVAQNIGSSTIGHQTVQHSVSQNNPLMPYSPSLYHNGGIG
jgi:hypothetical protein